MKVKLGGEHFKTSTKYKTLDPVYEETFTFGSKPTALLEHQPYPNTIHRTLATEP